MSDLYASRTDQLEYAKLAKTDLDTSLINTKDTETLFRYLLRRHPACNYSLAIMSTST